MKDTIFEYWSIQQELEACIEILSDQNVFTLYHMRGNATYI